MSDDIFCGAGKVPKNKRRGTMQECIEKNQFRYWGIKKIDSRVLAELDISKNIPETKGKLMIEYAKMNGRIKRLERELSQDVKKKSLTAKQIDEMTKEMKKCKSIRTKITKKLEKINNDESEKKNKNTNKTKTKTKIVKKKTTELKPTSKKTKTSKKTETSKKTKTSKKTETTKKSKKTKK
jgi:hypothetical protein